MVLSNCWGLFLIIVLLGYGLVVIPRSFWQSGDLELTLKFMQFRATVIDEGLIETKYQLDEIVKLVNAANYHINGNTELKSMLEIIASKCPLEYMEHHKAMQTHNSRDAIEQLGIITESKLVDLHKNLKKTLSEYRRSHSSWDMLMDSCIMLEDIIASMHSSDKKLKGMMWTPKEGPFSRYREILEWLWYTRAKPMLCRTLAVCFYIMSVLVVLGEITLFTDIPVGLIPLMFREDHGPIMNQIFVSIPLLYIIICTYYALFSLKLTGWYGLYPHNQTDPSNLVWSAFFLCRLSAPLCYNFLLFIKVTHTEYVRIMGIIDIVPVLGNQFAVFFPLLLIIFCALNYFHVYGKLMNSLGMSQFGFNDKYREEKISEGKAMIARERLERESKAGYRPDSQPQARSVKMNWEMAKRNINEKEVEKTYGTVKAPYLSSGFNI